MSCGTGSRRTSWRPPQRVVMATGSDAGCCSRTRMSSASRGPGRTSACTRRCSVPACTLTTRVRCVGKSYASSSVGLPRWWAGIPRGTLDGLACQRCDPCRSGRSWRSCSSAPAGGRDDRGAGAQVTVSRVSGHRTSLVAEGGDVVSEWRHCCAGTSLRAGRMRSVRSALESPRRAASHRARARRWPRGRST